MKKSLQPPTIARIAYMKINRPYGKYYSVFYSMSEGRRPLSASVLAMFHPPCPLWYDMEKKRRLVLFSIRLPVYTISTLAQSNISFRSKQPPNFIDYITILNQYFSSNFQNPSTPEKKMRTEEVPRVRIAVLGGDNVGKSGKRNGMNSKSVHINVTTIFSLKSVAQSIYFGTNCASLFPFFKRIFMQNLTEIVRIHSSDYIYMRYE